ncbi:Alpha-L-Rha alpha-1,2-L-rhamnosyltransferase/alpha-L-Rha alpha-1,3-L-rhamnosyltransferase [Paraburkholderia sabiae]|uniref:rhamnan synthesis F family protein n=1 Tax=Paraburkholderia sabiae TaxID=273251 RepID=UPI001CB30E08|nr:rhamnan synthesis F family protein [Paraburkholderia sabiae]CAG9213007.1 Alpha-L-Rha alpha-1,2-L-rhamnosyltransferase/alpha-L-Rha alpha-1,3-L-rhamnosyltransferase [Paraburkholderia sabiae]
MTAQLPPTGERFLPEFMPGEIALEHQHRYHVAVALARGLDVLDVASGEGYGASLLADVARSVVGVDVDAEAVEFATQKYGAATNLRFAEGSCSALPLAGASVDLVVSFETIEHHDQHEAMFAEIKRVLRPGGVLVISSPDKHEYSDVPNYRNPFHVKELYRDEFEALLGRWFRSHRMYGQRVRFASTLFDLKRENGTEGAIANFVVHDGSSAIEMSNSIIAPRYFVAVATDSTVVPVLAAGTFAEARGDSRIEQLAQDLEASRLLVDATRQQLSGVQSQSQAAKDEARRLRREIEEWRKHADALQARVDGQEGALRVLAEQHAQQLKDVRDLGLNEADATIERELGMLRAALSDRDAQMQRIVRSFSWRMTRPLRVGRRIASRLKARTMPADVTASDARAPVITADFNEAYYVRRYADVARTGADPYQHFISFGRAEGRKGAPPKLVLREVRHADGNRSARPTVLVVSHEATRTGAPILAWNICRQLREHYQVVVLLLGKGPLVDTFDEVCDAVAGPYSPDERDAIGLSAVMSGLCAKYTFDFAIVNSIASRAVLQSLAEQYVPSTLLVHEFFKFHCSPDELVDAFAWAGQVVFSASIVRDSADIERTHPAVSRVHILPQGKSLIPQEPIATKTRKSADLDTTARVDALRKKIVGDRSSKPFVVLGAGTIEYRKGVDLFVATAAEIKRVAPEANIVMAWVGGVVPNYRQYAEFVETQIRQSDLEDRVVFVGETPDLEELYRFADVCFISSRLDPLPNIALDAVTAGLPVLSFAGATGVAENFSGDPELERCVVPFLNVADAARRIVELYQAPAAREALSGRMIRLASERFDMSRYVDELVVLSKRGRTLIEQERQDIDALMAGQDFAEWFYLPTGSLTSRADAIQQFVKSAQGGIYIRKPAPGFYPHRYAEHHDLGPAIANPFAHYIAAGKPAGDWQELLLDVSQPRPPHTGAVRVAVHIHAFYPDLLADIVRRLSLNDLRADLFVSVPSEQTAAQAREELGGYRQGSHVIRVVPNRGRDIGPFITEFGAELQQYDVIGHFHTKKSVHVDPNSDLVRNWVNHLMETLVGGQHRAAERIVSAFADDNKLGLVFADDPHQIGWDENLPFGKSLGKALGLATLPEQFFPFPVGTMFWARPAALKPLFELGLDWEDYPSEPLPIDGSMLHAIERLLPSIAQHTGFGRRLTYAPGITR